MTIPELRRIIMVTDYQTHDNGCSIEYAFNSTFKELHLSNVQLYEELIRISSLEEDATPEQFAEYSISQWDALNLVIRHEYSVSLEQDENIMSLDKSISKITKK